MTPCTTLPSAGDAAARWAPSVPSLPADQVDLWIVHLDGWPTDDLAGILSADERRRAEAFAYPRDQHRFRVRRALLRGVLARYLRRDPAAVSFCYGPHGKPELAGCGRPAVHFSCTHSGPLALYAVAVDRRVGVDVEALRPLPEATAVAQLCCSSRERAGLAALPPDALEGAVLRAWTLKEAYLKATGQGLVLPPERVEVTVPPGAPAALHTADGDCGVAARWSLRAFQPVEGYTAALAWEAPSSIPLTVTTYRGDRLLPS